MSVDGSAASQPDGAEGFIKGIAITQLVIGILLAVAGFLTIEHGINLWLSAADSAQAPRPHGPSYYVDHGFSWLYIALLCTWLASHGLARCRSLRPLGVCLSGWVALKLAAASVLAFFMFPVLGDMVLQYKGRSLRLGDAIGGLLTGVSIALVLITLCMAALFLFYRSRAVQTALDRTDGARYWTDDVPLPLLFGTWMFVSLALDALGKLHELRADTWFGPFFGLTAAAIQLLTVAVLAALAWGFARRRPWAWYLALVASPLWLLLHYTTGIRSDDPELLRLQEYAHGMDLAGFVNRLLPMINADTCIELALSLIALLAVRKLFRPAPLPIVGARIRVMADPGMYWSASKRFMGALLLAVLMLLLRQYFLAVVMLLPLVFIYLYGVAALRVPALEFGPDAVSLRLHNLAFPPRYPYASLRQVCLLHTRPKDIRRYDPEEQRLSLPAATFTPAGLQQAKAEFEAHGIAVTVDAPG